MTENKNEKPNEAVKAHYSQVSDTVIESEGTTTTFTSKDSENASYEVVEGYEVVSLETTDQVKAKGKSSAPNPTGKGGFGDNPQHRNPGGWKKEDTLRFKIEKASSLNEQELEEIVNDISESKLLRKFAEATLNADWKMIKEITEMLYGKPKEFVDVTSKGESVSAPTVRIIDERQPDTPKEDS